MCRTYCGSRKCKWYRWVWDAVSATSYSCDNVRALGYRFLSERTTEWGCKGAYDVYNDVSASAYLT